MATTHERQFFLYASLVFYSVTVLVGALFSFSFTDPNLIISSNQVYWDWQQWMWHTWFDHPLLQAQTYIVLLTLQWLAFAVFGWQVWQHKGNSITGIWTTGVWLGLVGCAFFSYNALSHDVFNYMFNAKMVLIYHANPHIKIALDFVGDPWLRFMHNTHTPAPYGYGWTGLSVVPSMLGFGKFLSTWLLFRLMAILAVGLTGLVLWRWLTVTGQTHRRWMLLVIGCSPFILWEIVMSAHNDFWMLLPAITSLYILDRWRTMGGVWRVVLACLLLMFSIAVKFATLVLVPLMLFVLISRWFNKVALLQRLSTTANIALIASLLLFLPLLTARSQFFHPWYLTWPLVWLPLVRQRWWVALLSGLAVSSTFRYLFWIAAGGFEGLVLQHQQLITWFVGLLVAVCFWLVLHVRSRSV